MWRWLFGVFIVCCLFSCLFVQIKTCVILPISSGFSSGFSSGTSIQPSDPCPLVAINRAKNVCAPFATSNGTMNWLVNHPAYYYESYHGYFPWSEDDYSPMLPFDTDNPKFRI